MPRSAVITAALLLAAAGGAQAQKVHESIEPKQLERIITSMGLEPEALDLKGDTPRPAFTFELGGYRTLVVLFNDNTDAQLYMSFKKKVSEEQMNEWNATHRFARAYRDEDGEAVIESDLDFAGGVTEEAVKAWIRLYRDLAVSFAASLK